MTIRSKVDEVFPDARRTIAYKPGVAMMLGVNQTLMLCQLLYWDGKESRKGHIIKSQDEMECETGLTRSQQKTARSALQAAGLVTVVKSGNAPPTLTYQLHIEAIKLAWRAHLEEKAANLSQAVEEANKDELRRLPEKKIANRSAIKLRKEKRKIGNEPAEKPFMETPVTEDIKDSDASIETALMVDRFAGNRQSYPYRDDSRDDARTNTRNDASRAAAAEVSGTSVSRVPKREINERRRDINGMSVRRR